MLIETVIRRRQDHKVANPAYNILAIRVGGLKIEFRKFVRPTKAQPSQDELVWQNEG